MLCITTAFISYISFKEENSIWGWCTLVLSAANFAIFLVKLNNGTLT